MKFRLFSISLLFVLASGLAFAQVDTTKLVSDSIPKKQVIKKGNTYKLKEKSYYPSIVKKVESELKSQKFQLREAEKRVKTLESKVAKTQKKLEDLRIKAHDAKIKEKKNRLDYSTTRKKTVRNKRQPKNYKYYQDDDVQSLKRELRDLRKEIKELKDELKKK